MDVILSWWWNKILCAFKCNLLSCIIQIKMPYEEVSSSLYKFWNSSSQNELPSMITRIMTLQYPGKAKSSIDKTCSNKVKRKTECFGNPRYLSSGPAYYDLTMFWF